MSFTHDFEIKWDRGNVNKAPSVGLYLEYMNGKFPTNSKWLKYTFNLNLGKYCFLSNYLI